MRKLNASARRVRRVRSRRAIVRLRDRSALTGRRKQQHCENAHAHQHHCARPGELLVPQRHDRVDLRRPPRRHIDRERRRRDQRQRDADERRGSVALTPKISDAIRRAKRIRQRQPDRQADRGRQHAAPENHRQHASAATRPAPCGCRSRGSARTPGAPSRHTRRSRRAAARARRKRPSAPPHSSGRWRRCESTCSMVRMSVIGCSGSTDADGGRHRGREAQRIAGRADADIHPDAGACWKGT